jgi:hypothetical protein
MRVWWAVAVFVAGMSVSGLAQQSKNEFKVKPSRPERASKAAPVLKTADPTVAADAKELAAVEHEGIKAPASRLAKKTPAFRPVREKEQANPPINFKGGTGKNGARGAALPDPNKGRVRQKGGGKGQ